MAEPGINYIPLRGEKEIRLLHLHPKRTTSFLTPIEEEDVHCSLVHANLSDSPFYEALSYEWGLDVAETECEEGQENTDSEREYRALEGARSKFVWIDGEKVIVRSNLCDALHHIRSEKTRTKWINSFLHALRRIQIEEPRIIWVDALCINQANIEERSHQVSLMGQIYGQASTVLLWSGSKLREREIEGRLPKPFETLDLDLKRYKKATLLGKAEARTAVFLHILQLVELCAWSYWTRLWIIQEITLAKKIQINIFGSIIKWDTLSDFLSLIERDEEGFSKFIISIDNACSSTTLGKRRKFFARLSLPDQMIIEEYGSHFVNQYRSHILDSVFAKLCNERVLNAKNPLRSSTTISMFDLLQRYKGSQCSDSRDKIFGLYNFAPRCCMSAVPIDYSKHGYFLVGQLLHHQISHHGGLGREDRVLAQISEMHTLLIGGWWVSRPSASWIPASNPERRVKFEPYTASANVKVEILANMIGDIKFVTLCLSDLVMEEKAWTKEGVFNTPKNEREKDDDSQIVYDQLEEDGPENFFISRKWLADTSDLIQQHVKDSGPIDPWSGEINPPCGCKGAQQLLKTDQFQSTHTVYRDRLYNIVRLVQALVPKSCHTVLFAEEGGIIGLAPSNTHVDDIVCRFEDYRKLAVLRKVGSSYKLVGRAITLGKFYTNVELPGSWDEDLWAGIKGKATARVWADLPTLQMMAVDYLYDYIGPQFPGYWSIT